jgi:hypothetical protein
VTLTAGTDIGSESEVMERRVDVVIEQQVKGKP